MKLEIKNIFNIYLLSELKSYGWNIEINNGKVLGYDDISKAIPEKKTQTIIDNMMIKENAISNLLSIRLMPGITAATIIISFSTTLGKPFVIETMSAMGESLSTTIVNNDDVKLTLRKTGNEYDISVAENGNVIDALLKQQISEKTDLDAFYEYITWAEDKEKREKAKIINLNNSIAESKAIIAELSKKKNKLNEDLTAKTKYGQTSKKKLIDMKDDIKRSLYEFEMKKQARKRLIEQINETDDVRDDDLLHYSNHLKMLKNACAYYDDEYSIGEKEYQKNAKNILKKLIDGYKELSQIRTKYRQLVNNCEEE